MADLGVSPAAHRRPSRGRHRRLLDPALVAGAALLLLSAALRAEAIVGEGCVVHFPAHARAKAERILDTFGYRREQAAEWLGIDPGAGRVRIYLVEDLAGMREVAGEGVPEWAVAVTRRDDLLAFRLDKVDTTPNESLDLVMRHELVHHVLNHVMRAPPLRILPRWFEEGLCVNHAGIAYLQPDTSLERVAAAGKLPSFAEADELFAGNARSAAIAYRYGERAVKAFLVEFGDEALRRLLRAFGEGRPFPQAFEDATGVPLERFERRWRADVTPGVPLWLFVILENLELSLLCFGALIVAAAYARWRFVRRPRALAELEATSPPSSPPEPPPPPPSP